MPSRHSVSAIRRQSAIIAGWRLLAGMRSINSRRQSLAAAAKSFDWYSSATAVQRHQAQHQQRAQHGSPPEMPRLG
jgi:hypothetical protein